VLDAFAKEAGGKIRRHGRRACVLEVRRAERVIVATRVGVLAGVRGTNNLITMVRRNHANSARQVDRNRC
jgi:hypothetical protein